MANEYDVVVIGSGTGGYVAAIRAAQLGLKTACVERAPALGGTCLNWGCIPTKALLEHAHAYKVMQQAKDVWGLTLPDGPIGIDLNAVHARKDKIVKGLTDGIGMLFKKNKVEWVKGSARLLGKGQIEVTAEGQPAQKLTAKEIIVATGSSARSVPGITIDKKRIITSDEALHMKETPKSIIVMGSGAVGVEFASIFNRFGSQVTLIELLPRIVPQRRRSGLRGAGEVVRTAQDQGDDRHEGHLREADRQGRHHRSAAAGRQDREDHRGLSARGHRPRPGHERRRRRRARPEDGSRLHHRRRAVPHERAGHFGGRRRDHVRPRQEAARAARASVERRKASCWPSALPGHDVRPINYDHVPGCTYCDPEIGSVGLTEAQAKERGYDVRTSSFPFKVLGRARMANEIEGFVKIVAEKKYDEILGVHIIGPRATEIIAEATMMLRMECTGEELIRTIHAHPTMSEAIGEAAHGLHGALIHM